MREKIQESILSFFNLVEELDRDSNLFDDEMKVSNNYIIQRFQKTSLVLNELIGNMFRENYGIDGITYDNIEDVYNPLLTGFGSLHQTHEYLMSQGMDAYTS